MILQPVLFSFLCFYLTRLWHSLLIFAGCHIACDFYLKIAAAALFGICSLAGKFQNLEDQYAMGCVDDPDRCGAELYVLYILIDGGLSYMCFTY